MAKAISVRLGDDAERLRRRNQIAAQAAALGAGDEVRDEILAVGVVGAVSQRCIVTGVIAECKHAERLGERSSR